MATTPTNAQLPDTPVGHLASELIHRVNSLRKERGLELSDRIVLTVPEAADGASGLVREHDLVGEHRLMQASLDDQYLVNR